MLNETDTPIEPIVSELANFGIDAGYFVPTMTGLDKSIVDAHIGIRRFLRSKSVHDFDAQLQGSDNKKSVTINLLYPNKTVKRQLSLYRPRTKKGDPRMWIGRLAEYAKPLNLIALIVDPSGVLYALNCSQIEIWNSRLIVGSPLHTLLNQEMRSEVADELLDKLTTISARGFIDSMRDGPTGIGYTLETLLGIKANSNRAPDYKGIELKSGRLPTSGRAKNRSTMFSQIPNWELSYLKSGKQILQTYGYHNAIKNRDQLYCSVSTKPNSQGLFVQMDSTRELIENLAVKSDGSETPVVVWVLSDLEEALDAKHRETFWVKAVPRISGKSEQFHFTNVVHTRSPLINNFGLLIDSGKVEMDYTLSSKPSGGTRDHGYLFKIWPNDIDLLFPKPINYALSIQ